MVLYADLLSGRFLNYVCDELVEIPFLRHEIDYKKIIEESEVLKEINLNKYWKVILCLIVFCFLLRSTLINVMTKSDANFYCGTIFFFVAGLFPLMISMIEFFLGILLTIIFEMFCIPIPSFLEIYESKGMIQDCKEVFCEGVKYLFEKKEEVKIKKFKRGYYSGEVS